MERKRKRDWERPIVKPIRWLDSTTIKLIRQLKKIGQEFFLKKGQPRPLFVYFWSFQTNIITIFTTNQCEKMSCPSSIWRQDSNSQPLDHESSPMTTRPD